MTIIKDTVVEFIGITQIPMDVSSSQIMQQTCSLSHDYMYMDNMYFCVGIYEYKLLMYIHFSHLCENHLSESRFAAKKYNDLRVRRYGDMHVGHDGIHSYRI